MVEVGAGLNDYILYETRYVITYPCPYLIVNLSDLPLNTFTTILQMMYLDVFCERNILYLEYIFTDVQPPID